MLNLITKLVSVIFKGHGEVVVMVKPLESHVCYHRNPLKYNVHCRGQKSISGSQEDIFMVSTKKPVGGPESKHL